MAGSFELFRKYQRSLLVFVAILAMLAFFVLPPFLQMGSSSGGGDPLVASWTGGSIREAQIERAVAMRSMVNRFLVETAAAAGRDTSRLPLFPENEEAVVRTSLVEAEARKNGLVVSDAAINDFLSQWTNNLVSVEQFNGIISRLRLGPTGVTQQELFEALRTELVGRNMLVLFQTGFSGDPPGWRWDYFRRLEQTATIEAVPVAVETVVGEVPPPSEQSLRTFFEQYKNELPEARSETPGFREPHRVKYEYLVAKRDAYEASAAKEVTEAAIAEYYEKNKATMFRVKAESTDAVSEKEPKEKKPDAKELDDTKPDEKKPDAVEVEPLDKVVDTIREQLAREGATTKIDAVFTAVAGDLTRYSEDYALWQARREGGMSPPKPPDFEAIAKMQGLEAGRSELIPADKAFADGGIGGSFEFVPDAGSRFGIRQQRWLEMMFGPNTMSLRPVTSRDAPGNRYLSWKTEDQPEFTPSFETARENVEFSWRIVEGRSIARTKAEDVAAKAATHKQSLEATVVGLGDLKATGLQDLKVVQVGPFTWLSQTGEASAGASPVLSQPAGLAMPGKEFMKAVFDLEPEQAAVAFNEPRTVCYCIRLVSLEPAASELRERFLAGRSDQKRIAMVAQGEFSEVFGNWIEGLEDRYQLTWSRQPRAMDR
ncbi:MAG: SurA N-terminal domain-containing protein [Planctomycetia bacterium]|nr:SurA N-terminal domain-containing protein [Planctomycetia bacterium]